MPIMSCPRVEGGSRLHTMTFIPTIGLEVHAELATRTKMFCRSKNDPDETRPNANVCPVCLAHPGTLPVVNKEAVRHILRIGAAVGGTLADYTEFDRKSYFYPDIPKGYQISQYQRPLVAGGELAGILLTRVHLEEDTARSVHAGGKTLIDFNRAGIPLMELVTEPVIRDAGTAGRFARELQLLLRTLGAGEANLEKGEMRIEANVSVSQAADTYGTKVEVKNLNSFRSVERAIAHEIERQSGVIESGGTVVQETRGWDEVKQQTFSQRVKEGSADYRYFPEPDLPPFKLSEIGEFSLEAIRSSLPELPWHRRARYAEAFGLKDDAISYLVATTERSSFFDAAASVLGNDRELVTLAANYVVADLAGSFAKRGAERFDTLAPESFAKLVQLIAAGTLSSRGAKDTLALLVEKGGDPEKLAQGAGLIQVSDPSMLATAVEAVIAREEKAIAEYHTGKEAALQYLIGKAMKETGGAGNPEALRELLRKQLAG